MYDEVKPVDGLFHRLEVLPGLVVFNLHAVDLLCKDHVCAVHVLLVDLHAVCEVVLHGVHFIVYFVFH